MFGVNINFSFAEDIEDAFGKSLGEIVDNISNKVTRWNFKPSIKSPYFENYSYWTAPRESYWKTPLSDHIIGIAASSPRLEINECKTKAKEVVSILKTKYSSLDDNPAFNGFHIFDHDGEANNEKYLYAFSRRLEQGLKYITIVCMADTTYMIKVGLDSPDRCYTDKAKYMSIGKNHSLLFTSREIQSIYSYHFLDNANIDGGLGTDAMAWISYVGDSALLPVFGYSSNFLGANCNVSGKYVRLTIRYGSRYLEYATVSERKKRSKDQKLNSEKAQGL